MEVRTIQEVRDLAEKALGPWQGSAEYYLREGFQSRSAVLCYCELVWELRILDDGFVIEKIEIKNRDRVSTASEEADRILRGRGYVLFDE